MKKRKKTKKTNAARILDSLEVSYELREFEVDVNDLSAENAAINIGLPPDQVFKTLVVRGDKTEVFMACIPGEAELDLKTLAVVSGNKKVEMVPLKEVQPLTGYVRGGVSPIGTRKDYPVYLDESAFEWPFISISAGARGCLLLIEPEKLVRVVDAAVCQLSHNLD
ncbi:MAG: Cys-tRNA(Pro) deacylase [Syntrophomonadaceae bacterium]|nr:Cys-tRNA(Pro) deacylase [Syntrophomonadaceae bacterium]